ncbi:MAG: methyltransferase domain-containing protein [Nitrospinota bacterium]|nr:methyltransferase domain-containing protein [Nitrospinota bacterium]
MEQLIASPEKTQLPARLQNLATAIEAEREMTPRLARQLLLKANLQPEDLASLVDFGHPASDSYGRKLIYDGGFFEMMAMAWLPGDFSAIHDHGHTQWGAVQIFGPAEHAVFLVQDGEIKTLTRAPVKTGQVLSVGHQIVHQMGNNTSSNFVSFHLYGSYHRQGDITSCARIYDLQENMIQRTDGGVFFSLPEDQITQREAGPLPDYLTWLRHSVELLNRLNKMKTTGDLTAPLESRINSLIDGFFDPTHWQWFEEDVMRHVDADSGHMEDPGYWKLLRSELTAAAKLEKKLLFEDNRADPFFTYAELYDDVVGLPCLEEFMASYLKFAAKKYHWPMGNLKLLSIGCGTGLVEAFMIEQLGVKRENLLGIDLSEAMIRMAQRRIPARTGNILLQNSSATEWDITYCGLNVFQYMKAEDMEQGIEAAAQITKSEGFFMGDFITPDHIRWYPHVIRSQSGEVISLRNPQLVEKGNRTYQESEIINVSRRTDKMIITHEGKHLRFMPPLWRLRQRFQAAFKGPVDVYDAVTLEPIHDNADTCPSTRYLIIAQKKR